MFENDATTFFALYLDKPICIRSSAETTLVRPKDPWVAVVV